MKYDGSTRDDDTLNIHSAIYVPIIVLVIFDSFVTVSFIIPLIFVVPSSFTALIIVTVLIIFIPITVLTIIPIIITVHLTALISVTTDTIIIIPKTLFTCYFTFYYPIDQNKV